MCCCVYVYVCLCVDGRIDGLCYFAASILFSSMHDMLIHVRFLYQKLHLKLHFCDIIVLFLSKKIMNQNNEALMRCFCSYQKHDFCFKNIKNNKVPKMTSKIVQKLLLGSYEHFKFFGIQFRFVRNLRLAFIIGILCQKWCFKYEVLVMFFLLMSRREGFDI